MAAITIQTFRGENPRTTPRLLEETQATIAINCELERGRLEPLAGPLALEALPQSSRAIFRHRQDGWLGFARAANVVESDLPDALGDEPLGHLLITGDRPYPTQYLAGGYTCRLGLPRPGKAPRLEVVRGAQAETASCMAWGSRYAEIAPPRYGHETWLNPINTDGKEASVCRAQAWLDDGHCQPCGLEALAWIREWQPQMICDSKKSRSSAYCYTYVRFLANGRLRQESAPSPPTEVADVPDGNGCRLAGFEEPELAEHGVSHIRIYRTVAGLAGAAFRLVAEMPLPCASFMDTRDDRDVSAEVLQTATWDSIPDDAQGLISLENGIYAAFRGNELLLSEPYAPYAFPYEYRLVLADEIVALGRLENGLAVLTKGRPYVVSGPEPGQMQVARPGLEQACVAALSLAQTETGIIYASPDGLVSMGADGSGLVTGQIFTRRQWQGLEPGNILGCYLNGRYLAFFYGTNRGFILDHEGFGIIRIELARDMRVLGTRQHSQDDCVYLSIEQGGQCRVWQWQAGEALEYVWRSKPFFTSRLCSMRSLRLEFDETAKRRSMVKIYGPDLRRPKQKLKPDNSRTKRIQSMRCEKLWTLEICGKATVFEIRLGSGVEDLEYGL